MDILRPPSATSEREIPATPRAARGEQRSARIQGRPKSHATVASAGYRSFSPCPATEWKSAALSASMHAPPCCPPVGSDGRCSHAMVEFAHRIFQSGTRRIWEEFKKEEELPVNGELLWDNGTPFPEPCIDRLAPHIGKYEALAWLCRGLGFFAALGVAAAVNDKASKIPYVSVHC